MRVFWRKVKWGQSLILIDEDDGHEEELGGYRDTKRGIDALAKTFGYEPGRSQKGFPTIDEAKAFVESFRPWELHGATGVSVERDARPASASESIDQPDAPDQATESVAREHQRRRRWWEFWRKG